MRLQRGLTGWYEALQRIHGHVEDIQERGWAGLQARAWSTSHCVGLLASEASCTINRDKLNCTQGPAPADNATRTRVGTRGTRQGGCGRTVEGAIALW
jgi:hypothetical protein